MGAEGSTARCCCQSSDGDAPAETLVVRRLWQAREEPASDAEASPKARETERGEETPRQSAGEVFTVTLVKTGPGGLGVDVNHADKRTLRVVNMHSTPGLVQIWNRDHPDQRIEVGDRILSVNSIEGNAQAMIEDCRAQSTLVLQVRRGG